MYSKTPSAKTPAAYIKQLKEPRRSEIKELHEMIMKLVPNPKPRMYRNIIGYVDYHYKYASGREGDWFVLGLASQKNYISLYASLVEDGKYVAEMYQKDLPKADIGKSCIRFKKLEDVDKKVLKKIIKHSYKIAKANDFNFDASKR